MLSWSGYVRVTADELLDMVEALRVPDLIYTPSWYVFDPVKALGLILTRFQSAGDQYELSMLYDWSQSAISEIVNKVVTMVDESWQHLLDLEHNNLLSPENLQKYTKAIHWAGAPLETVWGFIDCTIRCITKPSKWRCTAYNWHKKFMHSNSKQSCFQMVCLDISLVLKRVAITTIFWPRVASSTYVHSMPFTLGPTMMTPHTFNIFRYSVIQLME